MSVALSYLCQWLYTHRCPKDIQYATVHLSQRQTQHASVHQLILVMVTLRVLSMLQAYHIWTRNPTQFQILYFHSIIPISYTHSLKFMTWKNSNLHETISSKPISPLSFWRGRGFSTCISSCYRKHALHFILTITITLMYYSCRLWEYILQPWFSEKQFRHWLVTSLKRYQKKEASWILQKQERSFPVTSCDCTV